jgi:uncharacterized membrane protein
MVELPPQTDQVSTAIGRNIEAIARLEETFVKNRGIADRIVDWVGGFSGSLTFVLLHLAVYGCWILINVGIFFWFPRFDPYPFLLLSVVVSLEAIFLSTFVLIKQNRMSKRADQRAHLDLQINLLAEREMTLMLQMLQRISTRLGVRALGDEIEEFTEETSVEALAEQLREKLPDD